MIAARRTGTRGAEKLRGEREQLLARHDHDVTERLSNIRCPTFVAAGRYDGIAPLANSEAIVSQIPGSELCVYEGGHIFFAQDPRALSEILEFLDQPSAGRPAGRSTGGCGGPRLGAVLKVKVDVSIGSCNRGCFWSLCFPLPSVRLKKLSQ